MKKALSEILSETSKITKKKERIEYLRANTNNALNKIIQMTYDDTEFDLPEGTPPYKPSEFDEPGNLYGEIRRLYLFTKDGNPNINNLKRESLFIQMLEFVNADDAKLLIGMKDKKLPYKGLTKLFVQEALPELFK